MSDALVREPSSIAVDAVVKTYEEGRIRALDGMDLHVAPGEYVALVGPSGCGKSTLLHLIAALDRPDSGSVVVAGHDLATERDLSHYRARHVGMVFQLHNLLPTLTALENVEMPMFELGVRSSERERRARRLLELVGLGDRERNRPTQLSGGERQRIAIARALANEPGVVLADEPTGSLDSRSGLQVMELLESVCRNRGATLVLVTHAPDLAARADRIVAMLDGRVLEAARIRHEVGETEGGAPPTSARQAAAGEASAAADVICAPTATTSPTTTSAGDSSVAASSARSPRRPETDSWSGSVPFETTAAGVDAGSPAATSPAAEPLEALEPHEEDERAACGAQARRSPARRRRRRGRSRS